MGIMARSTPNEKSPTPTMSSRAPTRKSIREDTGMGAIVKLSSSTMAVIGTTEDRASSIFSLSLLFIDASFTRKYFVFDLFYHNRAFSVNLYRVNFV